MKKRSTFIALGLTLIGIFVACLMFYSVLFKPVAWLSTSSPNQTYTVELTGNKTRSFYHRVGFNLIKNSQPLVQDAYVHSGDWMDISFELAYPEHAWIDENVLRFGRTRPRKRGDDTLLISNETSKAIRYLKVKSQDMFLVFDVPPDFSLKLYPSESGLPWISCEGEFEDGQRIKCNGVNFSPDDKLNEPLKFCMSINYDRVMIESPQLEGYDSLGNWKIPNIPKATACSP